MFFDKNEQSHWIRITNFADFDVQFDDWRRDKKKTGLSINTNMYIWSETNLELPNLLRYFHFNCNAKQKRICEAKTNLIDGMNDS